MKYVNTRQKQSYEKHCLDIEIIKCVNQQLMRLYRVNGLNVVLDRQRETLSLQLNIKNLTTLNNAMS